ncbi:hypothetical protein [Microvirga puerhi]|uniref:DUF2905 domain-containing protein n=1 Tax=Microvirga puerhi TaxID=2876078 RepID=A0ABS7VQ56_9HYPH|nr:hypothetical protein [Microvirga puerhi]MBZ6077048.1 hypothetical protein [Microvirga puerhi]
MPLRMFLIGLGVLLILCGLLLVAVRMIGAGPLSRAKIPRTATPDATLEPKGRSGLFDLKAQGPGIGLAVLGIIFLIAAAAI